MEPTIAMLLVAAIIGLLYWLYRKTRPSTDSSECPAKGRPVTALVLRSFILRRRFSLRKCCQFPFEVSVKHFLALKRPTGFARLGPTYWARDMHRFHRFTLINFY